jgi:hypothetical protein
MAAGSASANLSIAAKDIAQLSLTLVAWAANIGLA